MEFERLCTVFSKLTEIEIKILRKQIFYKRSNDKVDKLSRTLFEAIVENGSSIQFNLFKNDISTDTLRKLLQRLTEKVFEGLISNELMFNNELFDLKSKQVLLIRKKILLYDALAYRGITKYALLVLNQAIRLSIKVEYYDYLIIALEKKLVKMSLRQGISEYNKVFKSIQYYNECNIALKYSQYLIRLYSSNFDFRQKVLDGLSLKNAIKKVGNDYERTKSKSIKINLFNLKGVQYYNSGDYFSCLNNFKKLFQYLQRNKNFVFNSYFATCLLNIAECETMLLNFNKSLYYLDKIAKSPTRNDFNELLVTEMKFYNYYFSGELKDSMNCMNKIFAKIDNVIISKYLKAKFMFFAAVINFINMNYVQTTLYLKNCKHLDTDKDGWNIGIRIFTVMNYIVTNKLILAENSIESMRKYMSKVKGQGTFYERSKLILKIFTSLVHESFNFKTVYEIRSSEFSKLKDGNLLFSWNIKSPEMIPFDEWFISIMNFDNYNHKKAIQMKINKRLQK